MILKAQHAYHVSFFVCPRRVCCVHTENDDFHRPSSNILIFCTTPSINLIISLNQKPFSSSVFSICCSQMIIFFEKLTLFL